MSRLLPHLRLQHLRHVRLQDPVLPQRRKQVALVHRRPDPLEDVEPLRFGRDEAEGVQLREEGDEFVL